VLNRANRRAPLFGGAGDYAAFLRVLSEGQVVCPVHILGYCLMPNHWHLVLWPERDGELSDYVGWVTLTHTQRWHVFHHTVGSGHLYQGRFKSFPIEADGHLLTVWRYVERNALRAGLVARAEEWLWGSAAQRLAPSGEGLPLLVDGPVPRPADWLGWLNAPQTGREEQALRRCIQRGEPFGSRAWVAQTVATFGQETTQRPRGRPQKDRPDSRQPLLFDLWTPEGDDYDD
jgi:putative transposase